MADAPRHRMTLPGPVRWAIGIVAVLAIFLAGFMFGRATQIPFSTAWWKDFAQPVATGTAGVFALSAGLAALLGSHLISSRSHAATMIDIEHRDNAAKADVEHRDNAAKADQLWKRFEWVVNAATVENDDDPVIDAVQASEMVVSIRDAAKGVQDTHLVSMLNVFMDEQQGSLAAEMGLGGDTAPLEPDNGAQTEETR
ncbi:hypothetical protein [Mycobacterium sp. 29Ha]|uniref:hypothetical protein n=1 Tax=Mycobacterium sp. 29Ha TaxID=2939268 RepID=UPI002938F100|nr:hypothetical protein [Mycobacterium sp. 29Ha]MDV3133344.1 hypothetical protein [Mycobacterium sp. 29Ha]